MEGHVIKTSELADRLKALREEHEKEFLEKDHLTESQVQEIKDNALTMYVLKDKFNVNCNTKAEFNWNHHFVDKDSYIDTEFYRVATVDEFISHLGFSFPVPKKPIRLKTQLIQCYLEETECSYKLAWDTIIVFGEYSKSGVNRWSLSTYPAPDGYIDADIADLVEKDSHL